LSLQGTSRKVCLDLTTWTDAVKATGPDRWHSRSFSGKSPILNGLSKLTWKCFLANRRLSLYAGDPTIRGHGLADHTGETFDISGSSVTRTGSSYSQARVVILTTFPGRAIYVVPWTQVPLVNGIATTTHEQRLRPRFRRRKSYGWPSGPGKIGRYAAAL
jgi:hypothetical protein